ncbi:MAG TPA: amidase [Pyrinomonadaceae bacterium]|nr:amidase [Pyrinomonadaceae bacterium]
MEHFTLSEELTTKSATELAKLIRDRTVSPVEVVEAHLQRIERINQSLNAIVTLAPDALDRARAAEFALTTGREIGPLHGVPLTVKDTIETKGLRTTSGSRLLAEHIPARDAAVVARLKSAGAIVVGKTNTPEMAAYYESDNPVFKRTNNPYDLSRTSGGSSGGEAAAIAACLSPGGIGSDLAGSIRLPAHFCGIAGLKPTMGRVSMDGHVPAATGPLTLGGCIGPMARSVADLSLLFGVIAQPTESEISRHDGSRDPDAAPLQGVRVAWYADDGVAPVTRETRAAVVAAAKALRDCGLEVDETKPPGVEDGFRLWIELFARAVTVQLREFYRGKENQAGPQVAAMLGKFDARTDLNDSVNEAEKLAAAMVGRERLREELLRWMKATPLILAPVGSTPAFEHGARRVPVNGESISVWRAFSYSQTFNVFGLPSATVPVGRSAEGLPIGVQIIGRPFEEQTVLAAAALLESTLGGWQRPPKFQQSVE